MLFLTVPDLVIVFDLWPRFPPKLSSREIESEHEDCLSFHSCGSSCWPSVCSWFPKESYDEPEEPLLS